MIAHNADHFSTYKAIKIDWDEDECAAPLEKPQRAAEMLATKKKETPMVNRFELLNVDDTEDGSDDEEQNTSGLSFPSTMTESVVA